MLVLDEISRAQTEAERFESSLNDFRVLYLAVLSDENHRCIHVSKVEYPWHSTYLCIFQGLDVPKVPHGC